MSLLITVNSPRKSATHRLWVSLFLLGLFSLVVSPATLFAQNDEIPPPEDKVLTTGDGLSLHITYWGSLLKEDAPVVVLLHNQNGNRLDWPKAFPLLLQKENYAVVSVDLRGHGQSKGNDTLVGDPNAGAKVESTSLKPVDYANMVRFDMEAVKDFIFEEHQAKHLNMNKMAIIAPDMSANVAITFAAADWLKKPHPDGPVGFQTPRGQDVKAVVVLSPRSSMPGLPTTAPLRTIKAPLFNVAFLVAVGSKDKLDKNQAKKMYDTLKSPERENKDRMYMREYNSPGRGTELIGKGLGVEQAILAFLDLHVRKVSSEWRDRESKIGRSSSE